MKRNRWYYITISIIVATMTSSSLCFFLYLSHISQRSPYSSSSSSCGGLQEATPQQTPIYVYYVDMIVTAYCKNSCCCGDFADGITASGVPAVGKLIAAPHRYPFGTIMDVLGYGEASVQDRGGAIVGNKIDLLFPSHQEALQWGVQKLKVKVYLN